MLAVAVAAVAAVAVVAAVAAVAGLADLAATIQMSHLCGVKQLFLFFSISIFFQV